MLLQNHVLKKAIISITCFTRCACYRITFFARHMCIIIKHFTRKKHLKSSASEDMHVTEYIADVADAANAEESSYEKNARAMYSANK